MIVFNPNYLLEMKLNGNFFLVLIYIDLYTLKRGYLICEEGWGRIILSLTIYYPTVLLAKSKLKKLIKLTYIFQVFLKHMGKWVNFQPPLEEIKRDKS